MRKIIADGGRTVGGRDGEKNIRIARGKFGIYIQAKAAIRLDFSMDFKLHDAT
jgi:hypothetical protein